MGRSRRSEYWLWTLFTLIGAATFMAATDYAPSPASGFVPAAQLILGVGSFNTGTYCYRAALS